MLIVWLALTLSVACVLALGTLSDRMEKGLNQQSRDFLAGDRVLRAARPVDERWLSQAAADGLTLSRQLTFMTMTFAGDAAQLARVKAADGNYPLYGALMTRPANLRPAEGEVLVAPRLLALLGLKMGDSLEVGDATLLVAGEVLREPDSGFNPFQTAPGIIINTADVSKPAPSSRVGPVTWRYMFAGGPQQLQRFEDWLTPQLKADQRWYSREESSGAVIGLAFEALLIKLLEPVLPDKLPPAGVWPWLWSLGVIGRDGGVASLPATARHPSAARIAPRCVIGRLTLRLAVNCLLRQPWATQSQLAAFSLSFMLLGLLLVMRGDLLQCWQQQLPPESPNYFLLNMTGEQVEPVKQFLQQGDVAPVWSREEGDLVRILAKRLHYGNIIATKNNQQSDNRVDRARTPAAQ